MLILKRSVESNAIIKGYVNFIVELRSKSIVLRFLGVMGTQLLNTYYIEAAYDDEAEIEELKAHKEE